jgi:hypothetical protein
MKIIIVLMLVLSNIYYSNGQSFKYSVSSLPDSILKKVNTVIWEDQATLNIESAGKYIYNAHEVFTVLNSQGDFRFRKRYYIDKFNKIEDIEIKVYNSEGKEVKKYRRKDFVVRAAYDGISLVTDDQVMGLQIEKTEYPCTVEVNHEIKTTARILLPGWSFQGYDDYVVGSSITVNVPKELTLRYKIENSTINPEIKTTDKASSYTWTIKNPPIKSPEIGAGENTILPRLSLICDQFSFDGYDGNITDWKSFGEWNFQFYEETKDPFSAERKAEIQNLVKNAKTDDEKISLLYKYLQQNFRYISIQLGIGGFKPFAISFVDEKKYGDCKALSNYMRYLLRIIGIKSYPALVRAQYNAYTFDKSFPFDPFNHVILCVPRTKDTVWLECTSPYTDFNKLGNFTENRSVLLLTEKGGVLVSTPNSKSGDNVYSSSATVELQENGTGKAQVKIVGSGEFKFNFIGSLFNENKDDQKSYIVNELGFKQPDVFALEKREIGQDIVADLNMEIEKIPEFIAGSKMFLAPRLYKIWDIKLPKSENRQLDFYFREPFEKTDTSIFKLPEGFVSDALPEGRHIQCEYANYSTKYWYNATEKAIYSTAKLVLKQHRIPAAKYAAVKTFFDEVLKEDTQRMVIKKL